MFHDEIDEYLAGTSISETTARAYKYYLVACAEWAGANQIDLATVGAAALKGWITSHDTWSSSICYTAACAIRAFLAWRYGEAHPGRRLRIRREDPGPQRTMTEKEIVDLLASLDPDKPGGLRNLALILVMLDSGVRASEVCRITLDRLSLETLTFHVRTKGGKVREKFLTPETGEVLKRWLVLREKRAKPGVNTLFVSLKA